MKESRFKLFPDRGLSLEDQFFQNLCLLSGLLVVFVVVPVNHFQRLPPMVDRVIFGFGLVSFGLFALSRRGQHLKAIMILALLGCLDLLWFPNAGSQGSIGLYFFITTLLFVLFFKGIARIAGIGLVVANAIGLHLAEQAWPRLVTPFADPRDRLLDLVSGYLVSLLIASLILWVILAGFNREREQGQGTIRTLRASEERYRVLLADLVQTEAARKEAEARLHQVEKMDSLGSLAGGVAHDMNNVLGAILGLASAHAERAEPGSPLARDLGTITAACLRGGSLVKGLLGFARQGLAEVRNLDLNAIVTEQVALLGRTTLQRVRILPELAEDLRPIEGDPSALSHLLMNLCVNSVDAMPAGGTLTLLTRNEGPALVALEVRDSGTGMTPEVLKRATDPFFTTKPQGQGTGLGLAMVYTTVKAHQGTLRIQSEPGQGTRILMTFPALLAGPPALAQAGKPQLKPGLRPLRVLLVDDDDLIREAMGAVLTMLGHGPALAAGGEDALRQLEAGLQPEVVILDLNMPGLGGAGTLPRLRGLLPQVPVLLATGRVDDAALALVEAHAGVRLLPKPFDLFELQAQLELVADAGPAPVAPPAAGFALEALGP